LSSSIEDLHEGNALVFDSSACHAASLGLVVETEAKGESGFATSGVRAVTVQAVPSIVRIHRLVKGSLSTRLKYMPSPSIEGILMSSDCLRAVPGAGHLVLAASQQAVNTRLTGDEE
ncbi:hypothetical protein AX14_009517, partial [Amanita brunnescens Koide BX004]